MITREDRGAVAWVTFDNHQRRNAFTHEMYARLAELCAELDRADAVRVVVFQGKGDEAFVSGSDIADVGQIRTRADALAYESHLERALDTLERIGKPTIALIRGVVAGGGLALAACCDVRVAADNARAGVPIARTVGNALSLRNIARMVDVVGPATTKELLFGAKLVDAAAMLRCGLVIAVLPLPEVERAVAELAADIASNAPLTLRASKLAVHRVLEARRAALGADDDLLALAYESADFQEGVKAFFEKRTPVWTGR